MKKVLSIRLWRGGLSFCFATDRETFESDTLFFGRSGFSAEGVKELLARWNGRKSTACPEAVQVFVDMPSTVFIPEEVIDRCPLQEVLCAAGIEPNAACEPLVTESVYGVCAVVEIPRGITAVLREVWGDGLSIYSPLHESMSAYRRSGIMEWGFVVYPTQEHVYLALYGAGGNLLLAEVYPCRSAADMTYYLTELAAERGDVCSQTPIYLYGDRPRRYYPVVKKYFAKTRIL